MKSILGACHCGCFNFHTMVEHVIVSGLPLEHTVGTIDCPPLGRLVGPRASLSCTKRGHAWCSFDRIRVSGASLSFLFPGTIRPKVQLRKDGSTVVM